MTIEIDPKVKTYITISNQTKLTESLILIILEYSENNLWEYSRGGDNNISKLEHYYGPDIDNEDNEDRFDISYDIDDFDNDVFESWELYKEHIKLDSYICIPFSFWWSCDDDKIENYNGDTLHLKMNNKNYWIKVVKEEQSDIRKYLQAC